ncbi:MAG: arylsulfatase [Bryobacteraceae bacterium]|jgi:Arylsulfatase A and related enzymes|nr:arylsulfatase [Bryobacteraceae bacterium]
MHRREFLATLTAGGLMAQQAPARKPNVILILADDLGYGDLGCYGQKQIQTPNIDRLAAEGVRFTQAYAGSTVCAPSRCCLMTGKHTGHARVRGNAGRDASLTLEDVTVSEIFKKAGYRTGLFGKWSLGGLDTPGYPTKRGFDEWFGYFSQRHAHNYFPEHLLDGDHEVLLNGNFGAQKKDYAHDLFTKRALQFLEADDPRPFFLHVCYTIPHANNELGRDTGNGMEIPDNAPYTNRPWPEPEKNFAAMITHMDRDIGRIMEQLKKRGLDQNTLVIFTSDNGPHREGGHDPDFFKSGGPLRGIKRDLYEGGIRVPAIVRWRGTIPEGTVSDHPWAFWDFLPTVAELTGQPVPRDTDGISVLPALLGKAQRRHEFFYWEFHERGFAQAVRMGDWKAVRFGLNKPLELYDLKKDPGEKNNVAARHPDVVARIEKYLAAARTESELFPIREKS